MDARPRFSTRTLLTTLTLATAAPACGPTQVAFVDAEDVRMDPVKKHQSRSSGQYGDVYVLSLQGANEVNGWVGSSLETLGEVFEFLSERRLLGRNRDEWKVYGPYEDWRDRDLSWLVKLRGDEEAGEFEAYVGKRNASGESDMGLMLTGSVEVDDTTRFGGFMLDFDVVETYEDMLMLHEREKTYTGSLEVAFERELDSDAKYVDIDYDDFSVAMDYPVPEYFAAESYAFHRRPEGDGEFHVDFEHTFQTLLWSGPEVEQMVLDVQWDADGAGKARGQVLESDHSGDLTYGDLVIHECFDDNGHLTWRDLSDGYDDAFPDYDMGDPETCAGGLPGSPVK